MIYKSLGFLFVILAFIGLVLPVLPTTPFLLVAAACFARSSEKWHQWLLKHRFFGDLIRNWEENRSISKRSKVMAITMISLCGIYSVGFKLENIYLQILTSALLLYGLIFILRIKVSENSEYLEKR